jgi:hypothetical protein
MGSGIRGAVLFTACIFSVQAAHAWYGPICYSDRTTQLSLTIPSISGETAGDLKVDFDDNDGKVRLGGVRASPSVKNAHEVVLVRDPDSQNGVFAVVVTSPRSTTGYKFELEFRKDASECTGAIIKATDRAGGGLLAHSAPAAAPAVSSGSITLAVNHVKPRAARAPKPKGSPSPSPVSDEQSSAASAVQVVNLDDSGSAHADEGKAESQPMPTPSAGSEAPEVRDLTSSDTQTSHEQQPGHEQQAGQAAEETPVYAPAGGATGISPPSE